MGEILELDYDELISSSGGLIHRSAHNMYPAAFPSFTYLLTAGRILYRSFCQIRPVNGLDDEMSGE